MVFLVFFESLYFGHFLSFHTLRLEPPKNDVLRHHLGIFVWVYIDDILIFSGDGEDHQGHFDLVHELLQQNQSFPCIDK